VRKRIPIFMLAALLTVAIGAFAQQSGDQDAPRPQGDQNGQAPMQGSGEQGEHMGHGGHGGREGRMDPSKRAQMLTQRLNLTEDQQSKVKDIFTAQQKQMQSLMQDSSGPHEDKRAKFEQMRSETDSQIRAVLTGDQQQKFDTMLKDREQHMRGGREGGRNREHGGEGNDQPSNDNGQPPSNP
jgi:periplasmic protein CpxP/Spy